MPFQQTSGNDTSDAYGGGAAVAANYIEDVFSTYLYTGNGTSQTITNNIDLSGKGGLVWIKSRTRALNNILTDTVRGASVELFSDLTYGNITNTDDLTSFTSSGFNIGNGNGVNQASNTNYVSWTFRKQPKFFDVVTYTGTGSNMTISHNLSSVPGCMIVKRTNTTGNWSVYHSSLGNTQYLRLNTTNAAITDSTAWNNTTPTSTTFTVGTNLTGSGDTYVAYLFASNAGGFGAAGTDNVITCGSFTTDGSGNATVTLGYEPQWLMWKRSDGAGSWRILDSMRGFNAQPSTSSVDLEANTSSAEYAFGTVQAPNATGFSIDTGNASASYIYIAIRRGPMKTPTDATKVFAPVARTGTGAVANVTAGFNPDFAISAYRTAGEYMPLVDKLRGPTRWLTWQQGKTNSESPDYSGEWFTAFTNTGVTVGADNSGGKAVNSSGGSIVQYYFQRAPGFFDVVCYTGTGSATTQAHNLGVIPELIIVKKRSNATNSNWDTTFYVSASNAAAGYLNLTGSLPTVAWESTNLGAAPTASVFSIGGYSTVNESAATFVAYLFATVAGVSKVGSYTGTGTLTTINCGFTGGARYVLIKRTDASANWLMWDTARGMVSGTDPSISSNYQGAEINANSVYTIATGFQLLASPSADVNTNGGTYIYLAIA